MKAKIITTIRLILTLVMCYLIYTETGIFTAIFAAIIGIESELQSKINLKVVEFLKEIKSRS